MQSSEPSQFQGPSAHAHVSDRQDFLILISVASQPVIRLPSVQAVWIQ